MHVALAVAVVGVLRQHFAELAKAPFFPQLDHPFIHLLVKLAGVAVHTFFGTLIVDKTV
ncbi:hypothetical protein D3C75_1087590 [compost metagenome]